MPARVDFLCDRVQTKWGTLSQNNFLLESTEHDLVLVDELIECERNLVTIGDSVLSDHHRGQAWEPGVADGVNELMHLLALQKRTEGFAVMIFCVLK